MYWKGTTHMRGKNSTQKMKNLWTIRRRKKILWSSRLNNQVINKGKNVIVTRFLSADLKNFFCQKTVE